MAKTKDGKEEKQLIIQYVDIDSLIPAEYNPGTPPRRETGHSCQYKTFRDCRSDHCKPAS
jgi:hypothetical protein